MFLRYLCLAILLSTALNAQQAPASGDGIWRRWALSSEAQTFDACLGHQFSTGDYHNHAEPICLRAQLNDNLVLLHTLRTGPVFSETLPPWTHSPILGWAFDGYPIYGPYGFSSPMDAASPVTRLASSYQLRNIAARTSLPAWSLPIHTGISQQLTPTQYGPPVSAAYPLGRYVEDFDYIAALGDLDQYNGRFEVTPDFPNGTYAYHVTVDDSGNPVFPLIFGGQLYGVGSGGSTQTIPAGANSYFNASGLTISNLVTNLTAAPPYLTSWSTRRSTQAAEVISGLDPSAGAATTWPGVSAPINADVQTIQYDSSYVYINAKGLPSYTIGPWFDATLAGGTLTYFPTAQSYQLKFPISPSPVAAGGSYTNTASGPSGLFVNGVEASGFLDGASYSNSLGVDVGGEETILPTALHVSAASGEKGPAAPGSLVTGYALFGAQLAGTAEAASSATWPTTLGGVSVTLTDSAGNSRLALISYASPTQVNFQVPSAAATGFAAVTYTIGTGTIPGNLYILPAYPNLFFAAGNQPAGYVARLHNGVQTIENIDAPITLNSTDTVYLVFYGSGIGSAANVTATLGATTTTVAYAGPQGTYSGLDQYNILVPNSLAGQGPTPLAVTVSNRQSNTLTVTFQ